MNFRIKEKLMLWISGSKKNLFQRRKLVERLSFCSIYEDCIGLRNEEEGASALHNKNKKKVR